MTNSHRRIKRSADQKVKNLGHILRDEEKKKRNFHKSPPNPYELKIKSTANVKSLYAR